jgi:hypothetical protein
VSTTANADTTTLCLADFAERTRDTDLPGPVRDCSRLLAQMCLWSGKLAATTDAGSRLHAIVAATDALSPADPELGSVFGPLTAMSRSSAVTVNVGLMTMAGPTPAGGQPMPPIVASALAAGIAAAHLVGADGFGLLAAFAGGAEIGLRLAAGIDSSRPGSEWASQQLACPVASAVTTTMTLGGGADDIHQAIALGATQASGLGGPCIAVDSAFVSGELASHGFEAGVLTKSGWSGPARPLDGGRGLFHLLTGVAAPTAVTDGLGARWLLLDLVDTTTAWAGHGLEPLDAMSSGELALLLGR